ncbi:MAG: SDR family oxidoreductase [Candidatus Omnitrophica bacterium]|nr:SDR family oxidoreductase [Candidatus Omnitrophota bacterium]
MILIIGGAGYVGCVLTEELLKHQKKVRVFDKLVYGDSYLGEIKKKVELIVGDVRRFDAEHLRGVDTVFYLAGVTNDATADHNPKACYEINTHATERVALLCKEMGVRRFIFASSTSVYDHEVLANEGFFTETSSIAPKGPYAISKHEAEMALKKLASPQFCPIILRKGTLHGYSPRMRFDLVVNTFVKNGLMNGGFRVLNAGLAWRPILDIRDLIQAYFVCLEAPEDKVKAEIFNVATENLRVIEIADIVKETLKELTGRIVRIDIDRKDIHSRSYRASTEKIQNKLGFTPQYPLADSVRFLASKLREMRLTDLDNPIYYNYRWMTSRRRRTLQSTE